jgi:hypothetical protein
MTEKEFRQREKTIEEWYAEEKAKLRQKIEVLDKKYFTKLSNLHDEAFKTIEKEF